MRRILVAICGPGEQATEADVRDATALGAAIAREGWVVVTGGRDCGVMDAACRGARAAGGLTVGILPSSDTRGASDAVDIPIATGLGEARNNVLVLSSIAVVVCGMSAGTAAEVTLAVKAKRPIVLLRPTPETFAFFDRLSAGGVLAARSVEEAIDMVRGSG